MSSNGDAVPTYMAGGDPALQGYYPKWLDNLAEDATLEGSLLDGAAQGPEAIRAIVLAIRSLYERQEHKLAREYDFAFVEDYVATVRGRPIGCIVVVKRNAAGKAQHIEVGYRPRSSLLLMTRLLREKFAGTAWGKHFADSER